MVHPANSWFVTQMAQVVINYLLCQAAEHETTDKRIDTHVDATEELEITRGRNWWCVNVKSSSEPSAIFIAHVIGNCAQTRANI